MTRLWVLPLAAILCGSPVNPPRLKPPLPSPKDACAGNAQKFFFLAHAYRHESAEKSRLFLSKARQELNRCDEPVLRARIEELRNSAL